MKLAQKDLPKDWWTYHAQGCGTQYRGCAPDCPKHIWEETGEWIYPPEKIVEQALERLDNAKREMEEACEWCDRVKNLSGPTIKGSQLKEGMRVQRVIDGKPVQIMMVVIKGGPYYNNPLYADDDFMVFTNQPELDG